jgi:hypothetical protein
MKEEVEDKKELITTDATAKAVQVIKAAILQSQQRALKAMEELPNLQELTQIHLYRRVTDYDRNSE